jgi:hypothetical protein
LNYTLFVTSEDFAVAFEPGVEAFHDPAPWLEGWSARDETGLLVSRANMRHITIGHHDPFVSGVSLVGAEVFVNLSASRFLEKHPEAQPFFQGRDVVDAGAGDAERKRDATRVDLRV